MSLKQLKEALEQKQFMVVIEQAEALLSHDAAKNKAAFLFMAQAQIELGMAQEAQNSLNNLYPMLQLGKDKNDDMLYIQTLNTNQKIAAKIISDPQGGKNAQNSGLQMRRDNQFKIIEFYDFKKKFDKMMVEMETFLQILIEDGKYKDVEDNFVWLLNHQGLTDAQKVGYACRIPEIDPYYNPYTKIERVFGMVINLRGMEAPFEPEVVQVAQRVLAFLERQNWRKDVHSALSQINMNKGALEEFQRYLKSAIPAAEIVFAANPSQVLFGGDQAAIAHFTRAILAKTYTLQHNSEEWKLFVARLTNVTKMEVFQATIGDVESNPAQLVIHCILDLDRILSTQEVPDSDTTENLFFVKHFAKREDGHDVLMAFSNKYKGLSPFVNLYVTLCVTSLDWVGSKDPVDSINTKLSLATFLQRFIFKHKLGARMQPADMQVLACILNLRVAQHLSDEKRAELIGMTSKTVEAIQKFASDKIMVTYLNEQSGIQWKVHLQEGRWQDSIVELDRIAEVQPAKAPWVKMRTALIQFSFLDKIASNAEEQALFLQTTFNQLQEAQSASTKDAEALVLQGTMLFLNGSQLGAAGADPKACLTKWLLALKRDQTNADTFYCLALYYLCREQNFVKAQKCLDKALLLRPDFEEAFLLNFCLLTQEGKVEEAFGLIQKMQSVNRNVASTYYLGGLFQLKQRNYIQAIDDFQNATRFYTIARQNSQAGSNPLRKVYPLPQECSKEHNFALLRAKLGLFGSHEKQFVAVWAHLIQCFTKIDKPAVALKCFARAMEEIESILSSHLGELAGPVEDQEAAAYIGSLVVAVQKVKNADRLQMVETTDPGSEAVFKTLKKLNQILDATTGQVPAILLECIECLSVGARITVDQNLSIELALTSLRICQRVNVKNLINIVEAQVALLIQRLTEKLQSGSLISFGQVTIPSWVRNQLNLLAQMIEVSDQKLAECQPVQQACIHALYTMSRKMEDAEKSRTFLLDSFSRVEALITKLDIRPDSQVVHGPCARSLLLDAAKIALQCELVGINEASLVEKKLKYVKWALMLDPENAELWVHLYLCLTSDSPSDRAMRAKAIFKAYELSPEMQFVQEHLLKHYLSSPKTYSRAFNMILRITQQQQAEQLQNQQQATLPIVTATLAFLNARSYFGPGSLSQRRTDRKTQLHEAISLINLIDQRDDLIQMFQTLQVFLQHQKGDYLQTIKCLEHLCSSSESDDLVKLLLIESYLGVSNVQSVQSLKQRIDESTEGIDAAKFGSLVSDTKNLLRLDSKADVKARVEALISNEFKQRSSQVVSELILLQEILLDQQELPGNNVLDLGDDILETIEKLELQEQRALIIQSLTFCQMRDGEISSNAKIQDSGATGVEEESKEKNVKKDYLKFLIRASRIKPKTIDSISTHKDLIHAKFASMQYPYMYTGELQRQPQNPKDRAYIGLQQLLKSKQQKLLFAQKELMKNPSSVQANIDYVWGLLYNARMADAAKAIAIFKQKVDRCIVAVPNSQEQEEMAALERVLTEQDLASSPLSLCTDARLTSDSENPDEFTTQMLDRVSMGLVKTILTTSRAKKQHQLVTELTFLLQSLLLQRGQHTVYVKVVERMLTVAASLPKQEGLTQLISVLWCYKCLNKTSALFEMKKNASSTQEANLAVKVLQNGTVTREPLPGYLLQARSYQLVKNEMQAANAIEQTADDPSVARDIIMALGLFAQQAYKQFYLVSLGLVAGSKTQIEKMKESVLNEAKKQAYYTLAYAYYLKAFAECTFLAARRQGLTLAEDFDNEEDGAVYDEVYFRKKATASLTKASKACWHARDQSGELRKAIDYMLTTQLH